MTMKRALIASTVMASIFIASAAFAFKGYPVGEPVTMNEMELATVYLQLVDMEPRGMDSPTVKADVHLEADVHTVEGDKNDFGAGEWTPCLTISYALVNNDTDKKQGGTFMPMVVSDDPHYGANIKMMGVGNYKATHHIEPPSKAGMYRHTDSKTGVGRWWEPLDASYKFKCVGLNQDRLANASGGFPLLACWPG